MNTFFETRACPQCGTDFEAWDLWPADAKCGDCARKAFQERLRRAGEGRSFTVESIGGACPTQALGRTADDRPYYFRARHGDWSLRLGEPGWPEYRDWPHDDPDDHRIADGDDPSNGYMDDDEVLAILDKHLGRTR